MTLRGLEREGKKGRRIRGLPNPAFSSSRLLVPTLVAAVVASSTAHAAPADAGKAIADAGRDARADAASEGASDAGSDAGADDAGDAAGASIGGCVEIVPSGAQKPLIVDTFPLRGYSGYAATLEVRVEHGKGESVLPRGLELSSAVEAAKELKKAGFVIPDQDGGAAARLEAAGASAAQADRTLTTLLVPLLVLPAEPGRHVLTLPPLPISVARANGEIATVCTHPHTITVDDPIASTPNAEPRPNPPPLPQREEWTALKKSLQYGGAGALAGAAIAYALYKWSKRPKPVPPPPPPRPPWEIALEQLDEVRHAGLLDTGRFSEFFDRVNDAVRMYLGGRFGFDGLESTTDEIMAAMSKVAHFGLALPEVKLFLQECDLVKFASMTPTIEECRRALDQGERIVRATMPLEARMAAAQRADDDEVRI